jgi:small GTP-binding protein
LRTLQESLQHLAARFRDVHESVLSEAGRHREAAEGHPDLAALHALPEEFAVALDEGFATLPVAINMDAPLRVVLMGRTQAGKSTLLEALSQVPSSDLRGRGGQRTTRDVVVRSVAELPGVDIVDTPGVGARDGQDDYNKAFEEVPAADLIVWVASNDSTQEQTARALRQLAMLGKPIVVALNCRWPLQHPVKGPDFLADPTVAYRDLDGHRHRIEYHLAQVGVGSVRFVPVHADAAFEASRPTTDREAAVHLRAASRIDGLYEVLRSERDQFLRQRQAIQSCDQSRRPVADYLLVLGHAIQGLAAATQAGEAMDRDLLARLDRLIDTHDDLLHSALTNLVERRRTWHQHADVSGKIDRQWSKELDALQAEVEDAITGDLADLQEAMDREQHVAMQDWKSLPLSSFDLGPFTGFDSVGANRATQWGLAGVVGLASFGGMLAGAKVGAEVGAAAGLPGGPVGVAIGALGGAVGGAIGGALAGTVARIVLRPVKDFANTVFKGKAWVIQQRRTELKKKIHPVLNSIRDDLLNAHQDRVKQQHRDLQDVFDLRGEVLSQVGRSSAAWATAGTCLQEALNDLDATLARTLLTLDGRHRLAAAVRRARRVPGIANIVEVAEPVLLEGVAFGATTCEPLIVVPPPVPSVPAGQAIHAVMALTTGALEVSSLTPRSVHIILAEDRPPGGTLQVWQRLLGDFTNSQIRINTAADTFPDQEPST